MGMHDPIRPATSIFMTLPQMADALETTAATLRRNLKHLQERHGFPLRSPHQHRPHVWRRCQFERWIESQSGSQAGADEARKVAELAGLEGANVHVLQLARAGR